MTPDKPVPGFPFQAPPAGGGTVSGLLLALAGAALFSLKPVLVKLVYQDGLDSITLLALRMLLSLPLYLVIGVLLACRQPRLLERRKALAAAAAAGVLGYYLASWLDLLGLERIGAQLERLILFTYPALVALLGRLLFRQRLGRGAAAALLVSYAGVGLLFLQDYRLAGETVVAGSLLVLASACCFAGYVLFSKPLVGVLGSGLFTSVAMSAASGMILAHYAFTHAWSELLRVEPRSLLLVLGIALFGTVIPSFLVSAAILRIGPARTSIASTIGPVVTALLAVQWLGEPFGLQRLAGTALVIGAVVLLQLSERGRPLR